MAIRYNKAYNARIRNIVHNFNQSRNRAEKAGVPKNRLPRTVKVSELKASYPTRRELEKALTQLENFSRKATRDRISIGDSQTTRWNFDFVKANQNLAKEYFEREYKRVEKRTSKFVGERDYLNTISAKIETLGKNVNELDDKEFMASYNAINEFLGSSSLRKERYREFLSVVDEVMGVLEIDDDVKNNFFNKFQKLTPTQFLYAYDNNDIIARVYELYFIRNADGTVHLNTDVNSANDIMNSLFEQADLMVEDAKANSV